MKKLSIWLATAFVAVAVAACGSAQAAGGPATAPGSAAPSQPVATAAASQSGGSASVAAITIVAQNTAFTKPNVVAPANTPLAITFQNEDSVPHNISIVAADGTVVFQGDIFAGPADHTYNVPPLKAGTYQFRCDVHPGMDGTLNVR